MSIAPKLFATLSVLLVSLLASAASAAPTEINWDDLLPQTIDEMAAIYRSIADELSLQGKLDSGAREKGDMSRMELDTLEANLSSKHPEAVAFWDKVANMNERMQVERTKTNSELDGKTVRMPGYVLPLQTEDMNSCSSPTWVPAFTRQRHRRINWCL